MKRVREFGTFLTSSLFLAGIVLSLGCLNNPPSAPDVKTASAEQQPKFLKIGDGNSSLAKLVQVSKLITHKDGGKLVLKFQAHNGEDDDDEVELKLVLKVPPKSISHDAELSMSIDDEELIANVDISFAPHGITFSKPATLSIDAEGLNLPSGDANDYYFYYDNPDTGQWERMETRKIKVDLDDGELQIKGAKIPHFSRYAVGWGE